MKIRHPAFTKIGGLALSWLLRRLAGTLSLCYRNLTPLDVEPRQSNRTCPYMYAFWHENVTLLTACYAGPHLCTMISEHADGQIITEAGRHLRMNTVSGSTTRGGLRASRQMLRQKESVSLVITPDGPRGPARVAQGGVVYLASRSGLPIVPIAVGYRSAWRLPTWDRMALPCPGSKVYCVGGAPIHVPARAKRETLEVYRVKVQDALNEAQEAAEWLAQRKKDPPQTALMRKGA
jgi:lysophospholipid acyltransferase (LPLAT)-like uncharacterized protein